MRRQFLTYYDFKKTAKKLQFCQIFRFSKKRARKVNFVYDFKLMYKINEDSYAFNFFFQWKLKVHTFQQKRAFYLSMRSVRVIWEKCAFDFEKIAILSKIEKMRIKCAFSILAPWRRQKWKKRIFFYLGLTGFVVNAHFDC